MSKKTIASVIALIAASGAAQAQVNGEIVFTDLLTDGVWSVAPVANSTPTLRFDYSGGQNPVRLADIVEGPGGSFYVADSAYNVIADDLRLARITRLNNLFGAATSTTINSGFPIENPIGMALSDDGQYLATINNSPAAQSDTIKGVLGISTTPNGFVNTMYQQGPFSDPLPTFRAGTYIVNDPNSGDYFAMTVNGGLNGGSTDSTSASSLWRISVQDGTTLASTSTLVQDFGDNGTGFGFDITQMRGLGVDGNGDLYMTAFERGEIYKMTDPNGAATLSLLASGLSQPEAIEFNPFTGKLVVSLRDNLVNPSIIQMNTDGTGIETVAEGVFARGFAFVPAPSSIALLGLGGLAATRRRRG
ncbi:MAG: PEP-CTERM sorting domain-containing protein [Phycisphaerales bacterium JB037]